MFDFVSFIPRAIVQGIPLLFGSTGETLTEKSGNLNRKSARLCTEGAGAASAASSVRSCMSRRPAEPPG